MACLSGTTAAQFRPASAAVGRVGEPACPSGMGGPAGAQALWAGTRVWPGLRAPGGTAHEQHAGPGDAGHEPLLRRGATFAWLGGGLRPPRAGVGAAA